jgi:hypothetical protein
MAIKNGNKFVNFPKKYLKKNGSETSIQMTNWE